MGTVSHTAALELGFIIHSHDKGLLHPDTDGVWSVLHMSSAYLHSLTPQ